MCVCGVRVHVHVVVYYSGRLVDGTVFDSVYSREQKEEAFVFELGSGECTFWLWVEGGVRVVVLHAVHHETYVHETRATTPSTTFQERLFLVWIWA